MPAGILLPDIPVGGYLAGTRPGAHVYSIAHATPLPAVMLVIGYWQADRLVIALALIWLAPIGQDRLLGWASGTTTASRRPTRRPSGRQVARPRSGDREAKPYG